MTQTEWVQLVVALVLTLVAALLAAGEAALQAMSRSRAQAMVNNGLPNADKVAEIALDRPSYINTAKFLRTVVEISAIGLVALVIFNHFQPPWQRLLILVASMVVISFIMWGVAPHTLGRQHASSVARAAAAPVMALTTVFGFIPRVLIWLGNALTPGRGFADGPFSSEAELREMVDMAEARDLIAHDERDMIHSVFELGDTLAREVMVPRTDVVFIEQDKTLRQGLSLALRSGFSRIPVIKESLDEVVGILYVKDVMKRIFDNPEAEKREYVADLMRPAAFTPDSKPVDDLLRSMQRTRNHMIIVVDEFGGTSGLATIEDIVEEIVGEITDEYDAEPLLVERMDDVSYRVSARMPLDDVGDLFEMDLSDDDVETAGGLMAKELNMVPIPGSKVFWKGLEFTAEKTGGRRHQVEILIVRWLTEEEIEAGSEPEQDDGDD